MSQMILAMNHLGNSYHVSVVGALTSTVSPYGIRGIHWLSNRCLNTKELSMKWPLQYILIRIEINWEFFLNLLWPSQNIWTLQCCQRLTVKGPLTTNLTRQKNRLNASFSSEAKKLETSVSRNILSILVRLSTGTELHQNGHGRRWYEVRQISAICIQLDIFGESRFDLSFFLLLFFFKKLQFSLVPHWIFNFILTSL